LSALGEFVGRLIASATEAAAHPYPKSKEPKPQTAAALKGERGDASPDAEASAFVEIGNEPRSAIGAFVDRLIASAMEGGAHLYPKPYEPAAQSVATPAVDSGHASPSEHTPAPEPYSSIAPSMEARAELTLNAEQVAGPQNDVATGSERAPASSEAGNEPPPQEATSGNDKRSWTRWTTRTLQTHFKKTFGVDVSEEKVRRVLHQIGLSWKKAKKLLAKADPERRRAFVADIRALLDRVLHDDSLVLAHIDEAHVHQDADMGYGWSPRGDRLYVASSSPGLHAKVSLYGVYLYSESQVRIWEYPRANGEHTIEVLQRLRDEFAERPMIVVWDGASYHRSACVLEAAARLAIEIVRLPAYSPDFMPVEALWRWLRESVTYNHCHDSAAELIARVAAFVATINRDACALADRLWVKDELDPEEEKLRFSA
jgi:transposase